MSDIDKVFNKLKKPIYEEINNELSKQGILTADMIETWLIKNGYGWTYKDFLEERKARILKNIK